MNRSHRHHSRKEPFPFTKGLSLIQMAHKTQSPLNSLQTNSFPFQQGLVLYFSSEYQEKTKGKEKGKLEPIPADFRLEALNIHISSLII